MGKRSYAVGEPVSATLSGGTPRVDFVTGAVGYRLRKGNARGHPLVRACGIGTMPEAHIVDATAGLGRDAFLLASMGNRVTLIERAPAVHALLADGLARAKADIGAAAAVGRMTLLLGDAKGLLPTLGADIVLVDPMHPPRGNTALVKQEMRLLRQLVGDDQDVLELMRVALATARKRVVLKWPSPAPPLAGLPKPSHQIRGRTTRYEVFVARATQPGEPVSSS